MDFVFTEDQQMMTETIRSALADICTPDQLRQMAAAGDTYSEVRVRALCDLGLVGALVPDHLGGLGLSGPDVIGIAQACGAALLPEPLIDTIGVVLPALVTLDQTELVAQVLDQTATVAIRHSDAPLIPAADHATHLLDVTPERVLLIPMPPVTRQPSVDPLRPLFTATLPTGVTPIATGETAARVFAQTRDAGALFAAAQLLGVAQTAIDISVAYASDRQQFGRPIGANQAIKHQLASAQVAVEFARPVLHAAATLTPGAGPLSAARICHAKLACGAAAHTATKTAVQVHGGMGYSEEVDVHFYLKRALCLRHSWGTDTALRSRFSDRLDTHPFGVTHLFPQEP